MHDPTEYPTMIFGTCFTGICMYVLQIRQPHLFFFFLMTHTERIVIIMIMIAMNTTPPTATEVAKVTTLTPSGCEVLAVVVAV